MNGTSYVQPAVPKEPVAAPKRERSASAPVRTAQEDAGQKKNLDPVAADDDEPVEMISSAPREQISSPDVMWNKIVEVISRDERSFVSFVGRHSRGTEFDSGELVVTVRPGKIKHAEDKLGDITKAAKGLYGSDVYVTLRAGEPDEVSGRAEIMSETETSKIIEEDISVNDVAGDVENLFGIKPEII